MTTPNEDQLDDAPPLNLDLEQAVLGALLVWNDALDDLPFLESAHFFDQLHGAIYDAICRRLRAGRGVTPLDLCKEFENSKPIDGALTVPEYIRSLGTKAAMRRQVADYARTIVDLHDRRILILIGEALAGAAREASHDTSPRALIEEAEQRLYSLAEHSGHGRAEAMSFQDAAARAIEEVGDAYRNQSSGLKTHIPSLDQKLGGLAATDFIVLGGRASMGKTALATNIAFNVGLRDKVPVGFFSLEMSASQLATRLLSERIEVPSNKLRWGDITEHEFKRLIAEAERLKTLPVYTDELGGITIAQLMARARRMKRKHRIGLIVVDYLQLIHPSVSSGVITNKNHRF